MKPETFKTGHPGLTGVSAGKSGFSLIELLVVMTLLTFITVGLVLVFDQTQRTFRTGMAQVDVLESGRATMDMMTREVEQMSGFTGMGGDMVTFFAATPGNYVELVQELPGSVQPRTNILQDFFFVSQVNQEWIGTGYTIRNGAGGIGSLYRYTTNLHVRDVQPFTPLEGLFGLFVNELAKAPQDQRLSRVADGVIHLKVNAYGTNGFKLEPFYDFNVYTNITVDDDTTLSGIFYEFRSNAIPTAVEIELAVVESDVVETVQALPTAGTIRREYIEKQVGKVHVFRQRVPIRRVDLEAYR